MVLDGKKIAFFVADLYEDLEFWYPFLRLSEEGADVTIIGPSTGTYKGKHGIPATADKSAKNVEEGEYDALVIPGGFSPDYMRRSPEMVRFVRKMHMSGKIVAAICHAGWMLASADIIRGRKVTSYYSMKDDMINAGGDWINEATVRDGNLITARSVGDLPAFCREIIKAFT